MRKSKASASANRQIFINAPIACSRKRYAKLSRDDVARVALHLMIGEALKHNHDGELDEWCAAFVIRSGRSGLQLVCRASTGEWTSLSRATPTALGFSTQAPSDLPRAGLMRSRVIGSPITALNGVDD